MKLTHKTSKDSALAISHSMSHYYISNQASWQMSNMCLLSQMILPHHFRNSLWVTCLKSRFLIDPSLFYCSLISLLPVYKTGAEEKMGGMVDEELLNRSSSTPLFKERLIVWPPLIKIPGGREMGVMKTQMDWKAMSPLWYVIHICKKDILYWLNRDITCLPHLGTIERNWWIFFLFFKQIMCLDNPLLKDTSGYFFEAFCSAIFSRYFPQ